MSATEPKYTPGRWAVHSRSPHTVVPSAHVDRPIGGSCDPDREAEHYAKVLHGYGGCDAGTDFPDFARSRMTKEEAIANARLIAAAPELLSACECFVRAFMGRLRSERGLFALEAAQLAIKKAVEE